MKKLDSSYPYLAKYSTLSENVRDHGVGIIHFGVGGFHRAHQAVYTHDALAKHGGNWRILGVNLQSTQTADKLNAQDGMYSLLVRQPDGSSNLRLIQSIKSVEAAVRGAEKIFNALASPSTQIVSITVTEKAYGIRREDGSVDPEHDAIAHDLKKPDNPLGVVGMIARGLKLRMDGGLPPFTVMCCDNLPKNGDLVRGGVVDFARRLGEASLADWIEAEGAFPNSMVDRITPATTSELVDEVRDLLGVHDAVPVETEPFSQWVIEEKFACERPGWEDAGALFVGDVEPYERMKLRMLNGTHSLIAYMGFLNGKEFVRDVMTDNSMAALAKDHISAAAATIGTLGNINLENYSEELIKRFENPNIAHETYQIAMDGSQKLPQRIFEPAAECLKAGSSIEPFALVTAMWIRYCSGHCPDRGAYRLRDPRETELKVAFRGGANNPEKICRAFLKLPDLFPDELVKNADWCSEMVSQLERLMKEGCNPARWKT